MQAKRAGRPQDPSLVAARNYINGTKGKLKSMSWCRPCPVLVSVVLVITFMLIRVEAGQNGKTAYEDMLERVMKADPAVDFAALRFAYADNPPEGSGTDRDASRAMFIALRDKHYAKAIEEAEKVLNSKYVDINAHLVSAAAYKEKGNAEKEKFHRYVAEGLIKSILNTGNGKTKETAYTVIGVDEEYVVLRVFGLIPGSQALERDNGHHYDRLDATNPKTKEKVTLYFNVDKPFGALQKLFKG